ncbi:MFS transporter [Leifsonia sp. NPDC056665]|uniref:MFS transporter n=1 Tax=Leifsonia sp. NPDC056665 TaxID=3345901 RepID=UPI0036CF4EF8
MRLTVLAAANGVSSVGDTLTVVALMLALQNQSGGSFTVSLLVLLGLLPSVFLAPVVAPLLDRVETTRILVATLTARCLIGVLLAFAVDVPWILMLVAVGSVISAVDSPALMLLVPASQKPGANPAAGYARMDAFRSVGALAGPALAGLLVGLIGVRWVLLADAASYGVLAVVVILLGARRHPPAQKAAARPSWFQQVRVGPAALMANRTVGTAAIALAVAILFTSLITVAEVGYATTVLGAPAAVYGALVSVQAVGRLVSSTLIAPRLPEARQPAALIAGGLLMGGALVSLGLWPSMPAAFAGVFLVGIANALQSIAIRAIVVGAVERGEQGRAFAAVIAMNNGATMAGTAAAGPLVAAAGAAATLTVAGVGTLTATVPAILAVRAAANRVTGSG